MCTFFLYLTEDLRPRSNYIQWPNIDMARNTESRILYNLLLSILHFMGSKCYLMTRCKAPKQFHVSGKHHPAAWFFLVFSPNT